MTKLWGLAVGAAMLLSGGAARADLILNGSFEQPGQIAFWYYGTNGAIPGWTSNNNEIEIGSAGFYGAAPYAGAQVAELNGDKYDTISQTVTGLTVGAKYLLNWGYAGRTGGGSQQMDVFWGGTKIATNTAVGATAWTTNSAVLAATSSQMVLSFAAVNTGVAGVPNTGNLLDGVTLNAATAVPEPATIALMALGISALVAVRYRRRA